jgi:hypothetical protein
MPSRKLKAKKNASEKKKQMKLEFLDDISEAGKYPQVVSDQLLRLFDFDPSQARMLKDAIQTTIIMGKGEMELSSLKFIDSINCALTLRISNGDEGITTEDKVNFFCFLSIEGYEKMVNLIEPFCGSDLNGYQWL